MTPRRLLAVALIAVAALAALVAVGASFGDRQLDLSAGHTFTLSAASRQFLATLDRPVTVEVFYDRAQPGAREVTDLTRRFARASRRVRVRFADPNGARAISLRVASGAVAVTAGSGPPVVVRTPDEADLTGALAEAIGRQPPSVRSNQAPSQPLLPTPLGRSLLLWLPAILAPLLAPAAGALTVWRRRRHAAST